ncbi:hypothetical protein DFA_04565 [Cavenderia fasciculata]|uniref:DUF4326 domain-containing protein n=1 Tax=Cavenderia fasciculata TaxID=261658 RepID=F4PPY0_CACFS|nr:uncharacterized protein DFA_04565 [Cavenderia fasciculata]EGG22443.1 hypothetical protein DFA_04565 [Cavenderia fasciculata]|eukprot:XP_004360294.1 hypothetical protein DFA_04565 [Cavenderia fasciculata]
MSTKRKEIVEEDNKQQIKIVKREKESVSKYFEKLPSTSTSTLIDKKINHKTTVVRLQRKNGVVIQDCDLYIGRRIKRGGWDLPQSKWHNPFTRGNSDGLYDIVNKYEQHVRKNKELMNSLEELVGKRLGCWCKGKEPGVNPCHGDILVKLLNEHLLLKKEEEEKKKIKEKEQQQSDNNIIIKDQKVNYYQQEEEIEEEEEEDEDDDDE